MNTRKGAKERDKRRKSADPQLSSVGKFQLFSENVKNDAIIILKIHFASSNRADILYLLFHV